MVDAGAPDGGAPDGGTPDGGAPDGGTPHGGVNPDGTPLMAASEVQMVPRLPPSLSAPQSTLVYRRSPTHPGVRAQALREALGLPSLALFPTFGGQDGGLDGDDADRCHR